MFSHGSSTIAPPPPNPKTNPNSNWGGGGQFPLGQLSGYPSSQLQLQY